jgi:plastocyanin
MKTTRFIAPLFALSLLGAACGEGSEAALSASPTEIAIQDFAFAPKTSSVSVGDTIRWTNADDILHTVTSGIGQKQGVPGVTQDKNARPDGLFDQEVELEDTFEFTFEKAGTFKYFCAIHPGMVATVIVK